tara:strand:+ start:290 stop:688 length:399 start_codon:yes stop_codon:yes gene_type:complete
VLGFVSSAYLLGLHYQDNPEFCDINQGISCNTVNQSEYAKFLGVPVSVIGMGAYALFFIVAIGLLRGSFKKLYNPMFFLSLFGWIYSLYLTYIEFFVLNSVCLFCLVSFWLISMIVLLFYVCMYTVKIEKVV